jgi:hypothetical protein
MEAPRLVRQHRLDGCPLVVREFVAQDSSPRFRGLNHDPRACLDGPSIYRHLHPERRIWGKPDINRNRRVRSRMTQCIGTLDVIEAKSLLQTADLARALEKAVDLRFSAWSFARQLRKRNPEK